ncbi:hypothetical protein F183_A37730 [Bryobacterales bacterium F-183]|nr:hypothetical protein F183_A37730 [Bryobacterales bacterium F-183]
MTKERWEKIQHLFDRAADLEPQRRAELLERECSGDVHLRQQVESLLACDGIDALELAVGRAAVQATAAAAAAAANPQAPEIAGKFRTIRLLGEGGMGVVYEAEQSNPRRKVALKVMRGGRHASERHRRLLLREAEALGRLQHPGIATIYESGLTEDEQPYLAMELVNGETLQQYLARVPAPERLDKSSSHERIQLFLAICSAIHYAHLNGVIHRDIKPGNVILPSVDWSGSGSSNPSASTSTSGLRMPVKVLDFGLARITTDAEVTQSGVIQGSIPYMSPEQVRGDSARIDIRTDIYSLGVLLYEMLTGHHPYFTESTGLVEGASIICQTPPRSFRVWGRTYDEDLETVVLKALEKEPAHRYQSVLAFSEDLQRYLNDMPIQARPPSALYQFRKLFQRHRLAFASLGVVMMLIAAFAVISVIQANRIRAERDRANLEAANAEQVNEFLIGLFRDATPGDGATADLTARDLLNQGRHRLDRDLANQPELRARLLDNLGTFYHTLLPYSESIRSFQDSIAIRHSLYGPDGNVREADSWHGLATTYYNLGKYKEAADFYLHALAIRKKFPNEGELSETPQDLIGAATSLSQIGEHSRALELAKESRAWLDSHPGSLPRDRADTLEVIGQIYRRQGEPRQAIPYLKEALELKRKFNSGMPIMRSLNELGLANNLSGDPAEAEKYYKEVLQLAPKFFGDTNPNFAVLSMNYAASLNLLGKHKEAEPIVRRSIQIFETSGQANHPSMGDFRWALGESLLGQGRNQEANVEFRDALTRNLKNFGEKELRTANSYFHFAKSELSLGRLDSALQNADKSLKLIENMGRTKVVSYAVAQMVKGQTLLAMGRKDEARPYLERSHKQLTDLMGPNRVETKRAAAALAQANQ